MKVDKDGYIYSSCKLELLIHNVEIWKSVKYREHKILLTAYQLHIHYIAKSIGTPF